jgi:serine/threonine-protein kinase
MFGSRWIVGGRLGHSDTADVYEAEATSERRFAALKLFDASLGVEPAWSEHAALTRKLSELPGDGLARAYDLGIDPQLGQPYVASERLTFPTVTRYVAERGPLPLRVLAQALTTLAGALDAAHGAGIVHGGIKPQNVFVSFDNPHWARLTDFGVGRLRHAAGRGPAHLLGFSAPEGAATPAADRYALALVCFFGATGIPWYTALRGGEDAGTGSTTRRASERARSQGAELEPLFDAWFARALHVDPAARFATAVDMAAAFLEVFTGAPTAEMPARPSLSRGSATLPLADGARSSMPPARTPSSAPPAEATSQSALARGTGSGPPVQRTSSFPPQHTSSPPAQRASSFPPARSASSFPPGSRSSVPLAKAAVPRWFWFACAAMALVAVLALAWLSRY